MKEYECVRCNKVFSHKTDFMRHVNRKYLCTPADVNNPNSTKRPVNCHMCDKTFYNKSTLDRHLKTICAVVEDNIADDSDGDNIDDVSDEPIYAPTNDPIALKTPVDPNASVSTIIKTGSKFVCKYCGKGFTRSDNLERHVTNRCTEKKNISGSVDIEAIVKNLVQEQLDKLRTVSNTVIGSSTTNNIGQVNNVNTNSNNTNNINIKLVGYGQEDLTRISKSAMKKILQKGFESVPELINYLHFNKDKPEQHNVYISDLKSGYAHTFDGKRWIMVERDELINNMFDDKSSFLELQLGDLEKELDRKSVDKWVRFNDTCHEEPVRKTVKEALKLMLYNQRDIPEATRKMLKNAERQKILDQTQGKVS